jgi:hypothetical protein
MHIHDASQIASVEFEFPENPLTPAHSTPRPAEMLQITTMVMMHPCATKPTNQDLSSVSQPSLQTFYAASNLMSATYGNPPPAGLSNISKVSSALEQRQIPFA